jgi:hypothetical protein
VVCFPVQPPGHSCMIAHADTTCGIAGHTDMQLKGTCRAPRLACHARADGDGLSEPVAGTEVGGPVKHLFSASPRRQFGRRSHRKDASCNRQAWHGS